MHLFLDFIYFLKMSIAIIIPKKVKHEIIPATIPLTVKQSAILYVAKLNA